jgi:hypothetical protein
MKPYLDTNSAAELVGHLYLSEIPETIVSTILAVRSNTPLSIEAVTEDFLRFDSGISISNVDPRSFVLEFSKQSRLEVAKKAIENGNDKYTISS